MKYKQGTNPNSHKHSGGRFIKGISASPTTQFQKDGIPWNKNKKLPPLSIETREKISLAHKGKKLSEETKEKIRKIRTGTKRSAETLKKMSLNSSLRGKHPETAFKKGHIPYNKGKKRPELSGVNHHNWQGGKSFKPYTTDWTRTLRISIRERDHYTCQLCGEKQGDEALCVHHIDYNKENCDPSNLVSLCRSCHTKTIDKVSRDYWIDYFSLNTKKVEA